MILSLRQVFAALLCLTLMAGSLYASNQTDFMFMPWGGFRSTETWNDGSSHYGDDQMPDRWQKPKGRFATPEGILPLFNQIDREAKEPGWFHIIFLPLKKDSQTPEISGDSSASGENSGQGASASGNAQDYSRGHATAGNDDQPPDQEATMHSGGLWCDVPQCNGGPCIYREPAVDVVTPPASVSTNEYQTRGVSLSRKTNNIVSLLWRGKLTGQPLSTHCLADCFQERLSLQEDSPVEYYIVQGYNLIDVLPDNRIVSSWGRSGALNVWAPLTLMLPGCHYAQFNQNQETGDTDKITFFKEGQVYHHATERIDRSRFASLLGHGMAIRGIFVKRDGRIVTWCCYDIIRIWTEHDGNWLSEKIAPEALGNVDSLHCAHELDDGCLLFHCNNCDDPARPLVSIILFENESTWKHVAIAHPVSVLEDGSLYWWDDEGMYIWSKNSNNAVLCLNLHCLSSLPEVRQLSDGRIITVTFDDDRMYRIRIWTKKDDGTWYFLVLDECPRRCFIATMGNNRIVVWSYGFFWVITEDANWWTFSDRIKTFIDDMADRLLVLNNGQIVTLGRIAGSAEKRRSLIWTEHQNEWTSEIPADENGNPIQFDRALMLRDGSWVSWASSPWASSPWASSGVLSEFGGIRIWTYANNCYSSSLVSRRVGVSKVFELSGGWLIAVIPSFETDTVIVCNLFPARKDNPGNGTPHKQ